MLDLGFFLMLTQGFVPRSRKPHCERRCRGDEEWKAYRLRDPVQNA